MTDNSNLSAREKEILGLVAEGLTNREIAQRLSISHNTVKVHLSNIFEKIDVSSRTEATVFAIEHRIVDVPGGANQDAVSTPPGLWNFLLRHVWVSVAVSSLIVVGVILLSTNLFSNKTDQTSLSPSDGDERWQEFKSLPEPRTSLAVIEYDGDIYAIGGEGLDGVSGTVFRYLKKEDRWEVLSDKPTPVVAVRGVLLDEKIYIPGGETQSAELTDVLEIYDPRLDSWETGTPLPGPISDYTLIGYQGELFLFGGWDGRRICDSVWIYDPDAGAWREGLPMQFPRRNAGGVEIGGEILLIGGYDGQNQINTIETYTPGRVGDTTRDTRGAIPDGVEIYAVQSLANFIFAIGKLDGEDTIILNYDVINDIWLYSYTSKEHPILLDAALSASGRDLIFLGGIDSTGEIQNTYWHYTAVYTVSVPLITQ